MFREAHDRLQRRHSSEQKQDGEEDEQDDWVAAQHDLSYFQTAEYGGDDEEDEAALVDAEVAQLEAILRASQQQQPQPLQLLPSLPQSASPHSRQPSSSLTAGDKPEPTSTSSSSSSSPSLPLSAASTSAPAPPALPALTFDVHPALASEDVSSLPTASLQVALDANLAYQQSIQSSLSAIESELDRLAEERRLLLAVYQHSWLRSYSATTSTSPLLSLPRAALFTFPYLIAPSAPSTPTAASTAPLSSSDAISTPDCLLRTHPHRHHAVAWNEQERLALELGIQHTNQLAALRQAISALGNDARPDAVQAAIQSVQSTSPAHWLGVGCEAVDWSVIAASYVPSRSAMDCRLQWTNRLDPRINHAVWSEQEDAFLLRHAPSSAVKAMRHWVDVAAGMGTQRTAWQCMTRYVRTLRPVQAKDTAWSEEENKRLKWLVEEEEGSKDWVRVAERMDGRTDQQCMHRYLKVLKPLEQSQLAKGVWTVAADLRLRLAVLAYGLRWSEVARLVGGGRSDVSCRERWVNVLRGGEKSEALKRGGWSAEEEGRLRSVVAEVGELWTEVAERMQGRTDRMCRKKWRRMQANDKKQRDKQQQQRQPGQAEERKEEAAVDKETVDEAAQQVEVEVEGAAGEEREEMASDSEVKQVEQIVKVEGRLRSYRKRQRNEVREVAVGSKRRRRRGGGGAARWTTKPRKAADGTASSV